MNKITSNLTNAFQEFSQFLRSTDFSKALILGIAITLPILAAIYFEAFEIGLAIALGSLLSSPSDVTGSFKHKNYGILLSGSLAVIMSLLGGYLTRDFRILIPILGLTMFAISYLAVYGFRASLISFSGLFALVLSFANISDALAVHERALLIGIGALWYLLLTAIWHKINPKGPTEQFLTQSIELTSEYIKIRGELINSNSDREKLQKRLLDIQSELNEKHETLREILISSRTSSGASTYARRHLLIFIQLVDILELAMANPVNYDKMDELLKYHPQQVKSFRDMVAEMSSQLERIAMEMHSGKKLPRQLKLSEALKRVEKSMKSYVTEDGNFLDEGYLMLKNLYDYQVQQVEKIIKIERILNNANIKELSFIKKEEASRFLTSQEYDLKILWENLSLKSPIFKHSLRLAIVVMAGYAIGAYFSLQNSYWILLTIIVIMRPNYGLTKTRSKQRIIGTLIGGFIATGIVLLTQNQIVYAVLAIITLVFAFSMVQRNYKTSATFITLSVVFIYALLQPDVFNVIQFRILDTLIGAGLAAMGNAILWPSWEFLGIKAVIEASVKANKDFLQQIVKFYEEKGKAPTSYKISRKNAFLATSNLSSAFQRMTQEPKSKQKKLDKLYELVVLNHTFLSSLASMGTYIQNHHTTEASKYFKIYAASIEANLDKALGEIEDKDVKDNISIEKLEEASKFFTDKFYDLTHTADVEQHIFVEDSELGQELQEAQLIIEQLKWLRALSLKIVKRVSVIHLEE